MRGPPTRPRRARAGSGRRRLEQVADVPGSASVVSTASSPGDRPAPPGGRRDGTAPAATEVTGPVPLADLAGQARQLGGRGRHGAVRGPEGVEPLVVDAVERARCVTVLLRRRPRSARDDRPWSRRRPRSRRGRRLSGGASASESARERAAGGRHRSGQPRHAFGISAPARTGVHVARNDAVLLAQAGQELLPRDEAGRELENGRGVGEVLPDEHAGSERGLADAGGEEVDGFRRASGRRR